MPKSSRNQNNNKSISRNPLQHMRCLQYLHYTLEQILNPSVNCKYNSSVIESLLKKNLANIEIQDVQKLKRMIDEGQKEKVDYQERGEYINHPLLNKQKWYLDETRQLDSFGQQYLMKNIKQKQQDMLEERRQKKYQSLNVHKYSDSMHQNADKKFTQTIQFQLIQDDNSIGQSSMQNFITQKEKQSMQISDISKKAQLLKRGQHLQIINIQNQSKNIIQKQKNNSQLSGTIQGQNIEKLKQQSALKDNQDKSADALPALNTIKSKKRGSSSSKLIVQKGQTQTQTKVKRKYHRKPKEPTQIKQTQVKPKELTQVKPIQIKQGAEINQPDKIQIKNVINQENNQIPNQMQKEINQNPIQKQLNNLSQSINNSVQNLQSKQKKAIRKRKSKKQQPKNLQDNINTIKIEDNNKKQEQQNVQISSQKQKAVQNADLLKKIESIKPGQKQKVRRRKQHSQSSQKKRRLKSNKNIQQKIQNIINQNPKELDQIFKKFVGRQKQLANFGQLKKTQSVKKDKKNEMLDESQDKIQKLNENQIQKPLKNHQKQSGDQKDLCEPVLKIQNEKMIEQSDQHNKSKECNEEIQTIKNKIQEQVKEKGQTLNQQTLKNLLSQISDNKPKSIKVRKNKKSRELVKKQSSEQYNPEIVGQKKSKNQLKQQKKQQKQKRKYTRRKQTLNQNKKNEQALQNSQLELIKIVSKLNNSISEQNEQLSISKAASQLKKQPQREIEQINQSQKQRQNILNQTIQTATSKQQCLKQSFMSMGDSLQFVHVVKGSQKNEISMNNNKVNIIEFDNSIDSANKNSVSFQENSLQFINIKNTQKIQKKQEQEINNQAINEENPKKLTRKKTLQEIQQKNLDHIGKDLNINSNKQMIQEKIQQISSQNKKLITEIFSMANQGSELMKYQRRQRQYKSPLQPQKILKIVINYVGLGDTVKQQSDQEDEQQKQQSRQRKKKKDEEQLFLPCDANFDSD